MIAVIFPGQGSQQPGMGRDLHEKFDSARDVFDRVSSATNLSLTKICFELSDDELRQTQNAQLALFTAGLAAWSCLQSVPVTFFAGHSVGEYAAVVASGALSIEDGARLVQLRGEIMGASGQGRAGTMAAVLGMANDDLEKVCKSASSSDEVVVIANDNSPGQLVISGDTNAVQRATALASENGAKRVLPLNVSGAFHSPLMAQGSERLAERLSTLTFGAATHGKVVANVTAEPVDNTSEWPKLLANQLVSRVRWTESVRKLITLGTTTFVECGSGEVLTGLLRRIDKEAATGMAVTDSATLDAALQALNGKVMA
jgi:[acyl-carrier-protein] S-malonyltransferase